MDAGAVVKAQGKPNDLLERIANDPRFAAVSWAGGSSSSSSSSSSNGGGGSNKNPHNNKFLKK